MLCFCVSIKVTVTFSIVLGGRGFGVFAIDKRKVAEFLHFTLISHLISSIRSMILKNKEREDELIVYKRVFQETQAPPRMHVGGDHVVI